MYVNFLGTVSDRLSSDLIFQFETRVIPLLINNQELVSTRKAMIYRRIC